MESCNILDQVLSTRFFYFIFYFFNDGYEEKNIMYSSLEAENVFFTKKPLLHLKGS